MPAVATEVAQRRSAVVWVLLAVAIVFNVAGQLLLKRAAMAGGASDGGAQRAFLSPWFLTGVSSLGLSMLLWVQVLRKVPLTIAHPLTGTIFVIVPLASHYLWGEPLPPTRIFGVLVILVGVVLVARGG